MLFSYFLIHIKTLKFNNFPSVGPNTTKQSPCIPPYRGLLDSTKNIIGGHAVSESQHDKQTKRIACLNGRILN